MRILYGVQATGNGHITRARSMAPRLEAEGAKVDYLFSGRPADQLFDMAPFGMYQLRKGLSFAVRNGHLQTFNTIRQADIKRLRRDINELDTTRYDLVLTDFEPVTAWAARKNGTPCIGVGHQYAFAHNIPKAGGNLVSRAILHWFAPAQIALGSHWHHFDAPILPPLIPEPMDTPSVRTGGRDQVLVYLPFENTAEVISTLRQLERYQFHLFCGDKVPGQYGNVHVYPFGRTTFQARLRQCPSVICSAGFELTSEALNLGKRILVKPVQGQMEQVSNGLALQVLGLGWVLRRLDPEPIGVFLEHALPSRIRYPDVATALSRWLVAGDWSDPAALTESLWEQVELPQLDDRSPHFFAL